mmetsp:Transcript_39/g.62  ORF Transcript_39/g.62 Transcript_39/m.62 type:complete len:163 (-) Transcript_39:56-544(-)
MTDLFLRSAPQDEVFATNIAVAKRDHVEFMISAKQERGIVFCISAVKWSYPGRASMYHLVQLEQEGKLKSMKVKPFIVDQEKDRAFCKQNKVMVGVPMLQAWFDSQPIYFARNAWKTSQIVCGPLNADQYIKLIKLMTRAISQAQKTQSTLKAIDVNFLDEK